MKKNKFIDWQELVSDLLEVASLKQARLAEKLGVKQQSVSNWKTGLRNPGLESRNKLRSLAHENGFAVEGYVKNKELRDLFSKAQAADESLQSQVIESLKRLLC